MILFLRCYYQKIIDLIFPPFDGHYFCSITQYGGMHHEEGIWVVSFLDYDLGYFDENNKRVEPVDDPFNKKVLPMSRE